MGCGGSKLDELQPVALCRDRSQFLADAIRHRYSLAEAHAAYASSLRSVGASLHNFFVAAGGAAPGSPMLVLPSSRKGDAFPPLSPVSGCGSHLKFCPEDGDSDSDDECLHEHDGAFGGSGGAEGGGVYSYFHYARKGPPVSVVGFERVPPLGSEVGSVQVGSFGRDSGYPSSSFLDSSGCYYGYPYSNEGYPFGYGKFYASGFGGMDNRPMTADDSKLSHPPPPPSPPRTSAWDFLNPFGSFENYHRTYASSRSSREVREEEGIPELEDDEHEEVVKEVYGGWNSKDNASPAASSSTNGAFKEENGRKNNGKEAGKRVRTGKGGKNLPVDKNVVSDDVHHMHSEKGASVRVTSGSMSVPIVLKEIKSQFDKASASVEETSKMLEVGKAPFHQRKYEVSSKMIHALGPSLPIATILMPSNAKSGECSGKGAISCMETEQEKCMQSGNLSATLQKLYMWEKKLHEEVRAEEKLRLLHDKKCKQLKHLDHMGAEAEKVDATRAVIKKLSTKIRIAIRVIESISNRISKLRDDELWPQLNELIQGLLKMWQGVLNCHASQFRAIIEAQALDDVASASAGKLSDAHMEATMLLSLDLLNWIETFSCWIDSTKNYVKALNCWLLKCLNYQPEITPDGIAPFSPQRLGTPPIFIVCNSWSQAMDRISERGVVEAMQDFATGVFHVWQQHYMERRKRLLLLADKDMDRMLKALDNEDQKIQKAIDALKKRCLQLPSQHHLPFTRGIIHLSHTGEARSLHLGLKQIFETMESFAANSMEAYKQLRL